MPRALSIITMLLVAAPMSAGAATVCSKSGVCARFNPSFAPTARCIINYVEAHGVHIAAMRGYGRGTVRHSFHPSGRALDINQTARDDTTPFQTGRPTTAVR